MDPVVHYEMPAEDKSRMMKFYESVFGWQTKMLGKDMGEYVLATTAERDEKTMMPKKPGAINGGFFDKDMSKPAQYPSIVIAVKDIQDSMDKITAAGGEVLGEPMEIPGMGLYISFMDTEGNRVSIIQPAPM